MRGGGYEECDTPMCTKLQDSWSYYKRSCVPLITMSFVTFLQSEVVKYLENAPLQKESVLEHLCLTASSGIQSIESAKVILTYMLPKYRGIVEPHLRYCCSVWGCCSESKSSSLQKIQNRAAGVVTSNPHYVSAALVLQDLG